MYPNISWAFGCLSEIDKYSYSYSFFYTKEKQNMDTDQPICNHLHLYFLSSRVKMQIARVYIVKCQ